MVNHNLIVIYPSSTQLILLGHSEIIITRYVRDAKQPTVHVVGLGKKPENPEEPTNEAGGKRANSTHVAEAGMEPSAQEV